MTDLPDSTADRMADAPTPDGESVTGDDVPTSQTTMDASELEPEATEPVLDADSMAGDTAPTSESGIDTEVVVPVAAVVPDDEPQVRPRRRRSLAVRFGIAAVVGFVLAMGIGAGVMYAWGQQYQGRVLPGVRVGSTELGGLTREEASAEIETAYASLGDGQITVTGPDGHSTTIDYADIDRGPDTETVVDAALAAGRQGGPLANLFTEPHAALNGVTVDPAATYDRAKLAAAIEAFAATIDQTPKDASVLASLSGTFSVVTSKDGRAVDEAALLDALDPQLAALDTAGSIEVAAPIVPLAPAIDTTTAEVVKATADRMAADVVVSRGEDSWTIASAHLAPLIAFSTTADGSITPVLDEAGLDPLLDELAKKINQKVRDAGLKLVNGQVIATGKSREGRKLQKDGMKASIVSAIAARKTGMAPSPVAAVVKAVDPKLTTADAKAFAPRMKNISSYSVYYWIIINNHWGGNIEGPATVINGTVVPAGAKFDFWKVVGDLHDAPGVGPGNAIEGGKITVTGAFGGGICTTSTTLFNAAFRAGMIPLARQAHNEFIDRYPPGLDATVWIVGGTKQTMSFRNDTKYPILITRTVTKAGNKHWLNFHIWSVPNHRTYKITDLSIQHGPYAKDTVVSDPTKPVGYYYRNNYPADGAKVGVTVTIYDHGKKHWSKRYFSNYPAVDGVLIKGTGKT